MIKNNLRSYADIFNSNINKDFEVIISIVYKYDIKGIIEQIKNLFNNKKDKILEICINDCLMEIKKYDLKENQARKLERDTDEIIDFYQTDGYDEIIEEASYVDFDLIMKLIEHNNRVLKLPIDIDFLKNYCIHNIVKEKDIQIAVLFILLELSSVCHCLKHNNYDETNN